MLKPKITEDQKNASWGATLIFGHVKYLKDCELISLKSFIDDEVKRREEAIRKLEASHAR